MENLVWERISEYLSAKDGYSLWGSNGIESSDAIQGQLGNCWLVTAAMSIAKQPGRLKEIFKVQELNDAGVYALDLWLLGMPITVMLDDKMPLNKESLLPEYAQPSKDGALWGSLFEKAAGKYLGNYEIANAGGGGHGIEVMTGAPYSTIEHAEL